MPAYPEAVVTLLAKTVSNSAIRIWHRIKYNNNSRSFYDSNLNIWTTEHWALNTWDQEDWTEPLFIGIFFFFFTNILMTSYLFVLWILTTLEMFNSQLNKTILFPILIVVWFIFLFSWWKTNMLIFEKNIKWKVIIYILMEQGKILFQNEHEIQNRLFSRQFVLIEWTSSCILYINIAWKMYDIL